MTTPSNTIEELVGRVEAATGCDNALDIEIEIALFRPDALHKSVRANAAGTKLVFTRHDGSTNTHWAFDHTLSPTTRKAAIQALRSLARIKGDHNDEA